MQISTTLSMLAAAVFLASGSTRLYADEVRLESLDLNAMTQGWGSPQAAKSVDGHALKIGGKEFGHGVGTHADSSMVIDLKGAATKFTASVGVDAEVGQKGSVTFSVIVDGKKVFETPVLKGGDEAKDITVDLTGAKTLELMVGVGDDGIDFDHADWGDATIVLAAGATSKPVAKAAPEETMPEISRGDPKEPQIHGPRIVGTTPGRPFLFKVSYTGEGDVKIGAKNLPEGLTIDDAGIITGSIKTAGETVVELTATSAAGTNQRKLKIVAGEHKLALTPPMGWNSWNVWAGAVDAAKVRAAADAMISSGLAAKGYMYVNIDDTWEGKTRDANGEITTNHKFGDMKALADYVHSKGLKLGIYSSPGPRTCAGFIASYKHEDQDAATWAKWGIDYMKYDWCSYGEIERGHTLEGYKKPYIVMRQALDKVDRDIVYSLCQYGMGDVWNWGGGPEVGGNCWRTTGDITDNWRSMTSNGFHKDKELAQGASPGHWNDPDMLVVGKVGWGPSIHATKLTPNEQLTHITLWNMLASPLLIGCDMTQMDKFTTDLLCNPEVVDIDQDPLGRQAIRIAQAGGTGVWARSRYSDGTVAVALFNRGGAPANVSVKWAELDTVLEKSGSISGKQPVRDLWKRQNVGSQDGYEATVAKHGAVLIKVGTPKAQ